MGVCDINGFLTSGEWVLWRWKKRYKMMMRTRIGERKKRENWRRYHLLFFFSFNYTLTHKNIILIINLDVKRVPLRVFLLSFYFFIIFIVIIIIFFFTNFFFFQITKSELRDLVERRECPLGFLWGKFACLGWCTFDLVRSLSWYHIFYFFFQWAHTEG